MTNTAISLVDGNSFGSLIFTSSELSLGASYHIKIGDSVDFIPVKKVLKVKDVMGLLADCKINSQRMKDESRDAWG